MHFLQMYIHFTIMRYFGFQFFKPLSQCHISHSPFYKIDKCKNYETNKFHELLHIILGWLFEIMGMSLN